MVDCARGRGAEQPTALASLVVELDNWGLVFVDKVGYRVHLALHNRVHWYVSVGAV